CRAADLPSDGARRADPAARQDRRSEPVALRATYRHNRRRRNETKETDMTRTGWGAFCVSIVAATSSSSPPTTSGQAPWVAALACGTVGEPAPGMKPTT